MTNVISFDPGGVSGVAWWCDVTGFHAEEIPDGFEGYMQWADGWPTQPVPDLVTYETFRVRHNTHKLDPVAFETTTSTIGAIKADAWNFKAQYVGQTPTEAKSFATNDKLKQAGFWSPTPGGHANDASRHLLVRLFKLREPKIMERFL